MWLCRNTARPFKTLSTLMRELRFKRDAFKVLQFSYLQMCLLQSDHIVLTCFRTTNWSKALKVSHLVYLRVPNDRSLRVSSTRATSYTRGAEAYEACPSKLTCISLRLVSFFGLGVLTRSQSKKRAACFARETIKCVSIHACIAPLQIHAPLVTGQLVLFQFPLFNK